MPSALILVECKMSCAPRGWGREGGLKESNRRRWKRREERRPARREDVIISEAESRTLAKSWRTFRQSPSPSSSTLLSNNRAARQFHSNRPPPVDVVVSTDFPSSLPFVLLDEKIFATIVGRLVNSRPEIRVSGAKWYSGESIETTRYGWQKKGEGKKKNGNCALCFRVRGR